MLAQALKRFAICLKLAARLCSWLLFPFTILPAICRGNCKSVCLMLASVQRRGGGPTARHRVDYQSSLAHLGGDQHVVAPGAERLSEGLLRDALRILVRDISKGITPTSKVTLSLAVY
jgi:hypothetical protein